MKKQTVFWYERVLVPIPSRWRALLRLPLRTRLKWKRWTVTIQDGDLITSGGKSKEGGDIRE